MLRITAISNHDSVTLKLEGKLLDAWRDELQDACHHASQSSDDVRLDLSDVSYIDRSGIKALRTLLNGGITISRCSSFVAELLQEPEQV